MISPATLHNLLAQHGSTFYTGVPDSLLKNLCAYITDNAAANDHIIAANEGGAVGLAAGHYLATGRIPVVYMQNSGLGNTVNPLLSLTDGDVYRIPVLLIIGWRGEPGVKDEPQHKKQGRVTGALLDAMGIHYEVMADDESQLPAQIDRAYSHMLTTGEAFALVVRKGTFDSYRLQRTAANDCPMSREEAICTVAAALGADDIVVSTTGMISRELFEHRERSRQGHERDFLTVGSMGHASQIALGIALSKPRRRIFCFDGDGATLMHMGSLGIVGTQAPANLIHIIFNNGAHDSVGGQPTVAMQVDLNGVARDCGYKTVETVHDMLQLQTALNRLPQMEAPALIEVRVRRGARADLGRPTTTPEQNKKALMDFLAKD